MRETVLTLGLAAGLAGCVAADGPLPAAASGASVQVDFEAGSLGTPSVAVPSGVRLLAEPEDGVLVTDVVPLQGEKSLCIDGAGGAHRLSVEVPDGRGLGNDRPLELGFAWRMAGFGRAEIVWSVSGQPLQTWRLIVARAVHPDAEPEPIGGFFVPEVEQPLFLFDNGGSYRILVTVDPVEREPFDGLRQFRVVVSDTGTPDATRVVYDSYGFFEPGAPIPEAYAGQSLTVAVEQPGPGTVPCLDSALTLDSLTFARDE